MFNAVQSFANAVAAAAAGGSSSTTSSTSTSCPNVGNNCEFVGGSLSGGTAVDFEPSSQLKATIGGGPLQQSPQNGEKCVLF